jgi:glyoxylase-like metal-dependent hydrolase (beta-lactamase superfamily II)
MSVADPAEALAQAARAGIHRLRIPTPFLVGRVNCYLIKDDPLTLVDTGPNSGTSLDSLERALADHDLAIEDLERVVITHQHVDHGGLLDIIARRSGAEVAAFGPLTPWLADYRGSARADDAFAQEVMHRHGVPEDIVTVLASVASAFRAYGSSGTVTRPLRPGDRLEFRDRSLQVFHRPGHSPSDIVFWDEPRGLLIGGDHLLAHISSNAIVSRPLDGARDGERPRPLLTYIESMRATREMPVSSVLGGHGDPVVDHAKLIDERLRMHERRSRKILRMLEGAPLSAYEIAVKMWGNVAVTQAFLTISEVLGHLDILLAENAVTEGDADGVTRFRPAG